MVKVHETSAFSVSPELVSVYAPSYIEDYYNSRKEFAILEHNKGLKIMKEVTAAIILKDNKILIAQRAPSENLAGKWEFPGGKTEAGETPQQCLKREIREELDVDIEILDFFDESIYAYRSGTIKLMAFWCKWISGEFTLKVHSRIEWVNRHELDLYDFAPADIPLVERLKAVMS